MNIDPRKTKPVHVITFVISLKNNASGLRESLKSISTQKGADQVTVLIIDSNSSDFPIDVVLEFEKEINIVFVSSFDRGIYEAWNKAVELVETEWLTFLGSGDLINNEAIASLLAAVDGDASFDILSSKSRNIYPNGIKTIGGKPFDYPEFSRFFSINHSGVLYRKNVFERFGNFDARYRCSGDYEYLIRIGKRARFGFLDLVVSDYLVGGISSSSLLPLKETFQVRKKYRTVTGFENWALWFRGVASFFYVKWFR